MQSGVLIAIDGLDGSGKETQSRLICRRLDEAGIKNRFISFPTYEKDSSALVNMYLSGRFGEDPGAVNAYAASSFYAADRFCSYMLDWKKDFDEGAVIIANRYTSANLVHQMSKLEKSDWDGFIDWIHDYEFAKLGLPRPDAVFYLCLPPALSRFLIESRCRETGVTKDIHEKDASFLENSYNAALYASDKCAWHRVDCAANGVLRSIEDINEGLYAEVCGIIAARREAAKKE